MLLLSRLLPPFWAGLGLAAVISCTSPRELVLLVNEAEAAPSHALAAARAQAEALASNLRAAQAWQGKVSAQVAAVSSTAGNRDLLVPLALFEAVPPTHQCSHAVYGGSTVPEPADSAQFSLTLLQREAEFSLDGLVVAVPRSRIDWWLALAATARAQGVAIARYVNPEAVPPGGQLGVVFVEDKARARSWLSSRSVDGAPSLADDPASAKVPLDFRATHLLCVAAADGKQPSTPRQPVRNKRCKSGAPCVFSVPPEWWSLRRADADLPFEGSGASVVFGRQGTGPGELSEPDAVAVDDQGRILVSDETQRRVHVFAPSGQWLHSFPDKPFADLITGLAVAPDGDVLVLVLGKQPVHVFDRHHRLRRRWGSVPDPATRETPQPPAQPPRTHDREAGQLVRPFGITVGPDGRVYIADDLKREIHVFSAEGQPLLVIKGRGSGRGGFERIESMAVGPKGLLYVADEAQSLIHVFSPQGRLLRILEPAPAIATRPMGHIEGLAFDREGRLWIVDEDAGLLRAFTTHDHSKEVGFLARGVGPEPGFLASPDGLAYDTKRHRLYVADDLNYRVQGFDIANMRAPHERQKITKSATAGLPQNATQPPDEHTVVSRSLVIGRVSPKPEASIGKYAPIANYLAQRLSKPGDPRIGKVRVFSNPAQLTAAMQRGEVDVVIESSLLALVIAQASQARPLAIGAKYGQPKYAAVVFARSDAPISSLRDLAGRTLAFEDMYSTSGYLLPAALLRGAGLSLVEDTSAHKGLFPSTLGRSVPQRTTQRTPGAASAVHFRFLGDEAAIARSVLLGESDAGAFSNRDYARLGDAATSRLKVIHRSDDIAYTLVLGSANLDAAVRQQLTQALLDVNEADPAVLKPSKNGRFYAVDDSLVVPFLRSSEVILPHVSAVLKDWRAIQ